MGEVKSTVIWQSIIGGTTYRVVKYDGHPNQESSGHTGGVSLEKMVIRPDKTWFWHALMGESFNPTDAASNPLAPLFSSWDEVMMAYPRLVMPETFKTEEEVLAFIEDVRKRQVDRYLDRASETFGKYWNPERAKQARERVAQTRAKLKEIIADLQKLADEE